MTARLHARAPAIVLAGGRSRRFGSDKLGVRLADGRTVLAHAVAAAEAVAGELVIVIAPGAERPDGLPERARIVHDPEPEGGPLIGLAAGLEAVGDGLVLVIGGDMPALEPSVLRLLSAALGDDRNVDAARLEDQRSVVEGGTGPAVLPCAVRREAARLVCREALAAGDRRLRGCLERLATTVVPAAEWRALDPAGRTLLDIDRPGDLAALEQRDAPG
jgi:molybdopterin-guanine dinucleotide biosynthesis protein A